MTEQDIISVKEAKDWLSTEDDQVLPRLIAGSVDWVERYTGYRLYRRSIVVKVSGYSTVVTGYPAEVVSVTDVNNQPVSFYATNTPSGVLVRYGHGAHNINVDVGYGSLGEVPPILVEAAYKLLTYLYENRDIYSIGMPNDVQFMINKMRRNLV